MTLASALATLRRHFRGYVCEVDGTTAAVCCGTPGCPETHLATTPAALLAALPGAGWREVPGRGWCGPACCRAQEVQP